MPESAQSRPHDIVVFGATGFTGALTAEYLAAHAGPETRWALAGRNADKLARVRERIGAEVDVVRADVDDPASLRELAEGARVVITTVGPYISYGEPLVEACAQAGTDYVDLTGEPEFVDLMWLRHHRDAERNGARIVHACGFDSIPHDLGVLHVVRRLPEDVPLKVEGFVRAGGRPSGGTFHSAITAFSRVRSTARTARERREEEGRPKDRRVRAVAGRLKRAPDNLGWAVPFPTIDPQIVARSARALPRYGPDFTYSHYAAVKHLPYVAGMAGGVGTMFALAQIPPTRNAMLKLLSPGDGPSEEQRAKSWFKVRVVGEGGGQRVVSEVRGGDPGYTETAKMLGESALCLAHDDLPATAGQVTTAAAMGDALISRLERVGMEFASLDVTIRDYERRFRRAGLPLFIEDYSATKDVYTRAVPLLGLFFVGETLGALNLSWGVWANIGAVLAGLALVLGAVGMVNRSRGRRFLSIPDRVGKTELALFVVIPGVLPVIFGGQWRSGLATAVGNVLLLLLIYGVVGYGLLWILRWAASRLVGALANSLAILARAIPLLLVFALLLVLTPEMWQVFANIPNVFLGLVAALFVALGTMFLTARLPREVADLEAANAAEAPLRRAQRFNVGLVMFVSQALQVLVVSLAVGGFFVLFGMLAISDKIRAEWQERASHVIFELHLFGHPLTMTVELLKVSGALAAFSGLYYAIAVLTDDTYRREFLDELSAQLRGVFRLRTEYLQRLRRGNRVAMDTPGQG